MTVQSYKEELAQIEQREKERQERYSRADEADRAKFLKLVEELWCQVKAADEAKLLQIVKDCAAVAERRHKRRVAYEQDGAADALRKQELDAEYGNFGRRRMQEAFDRIEQDRMRSSHRAPEGLPAEPNMIKNRCPSCGAEVGKPPTICEKCHIGISVERSLLFDEAKPFSRASRSSKESLYSQDGTLHGAYLTDTKNNQGDR